MKQSILKTIPVIFIIASLASFKVAAEDSNLHIIDRQRLAAIPGSELGDTVGESIDDFTLFALQDDVLVPIPHQFDEYDLDGYVYFESSGIEVDGFISVLDENDKLLFMIADAGPKKSNRHRVDGNIVAEIKVTLSTGEDRYVYLVKGSRLRADTQYVRYSTELGQVETDHFSLRVDPDNALNWIKFDWDRYSGKSRGNPLDTMKIRITSGVVTSVTKLTIGNKQMVAQPTEEKPGPVRATTQYKLTAIVMGVPLLAMNLQIHRTAYNITYDVRVEMPEGRRRLLRNPSLTLTLDGNNLYDSEIRTALGPKATAKVDGKLSPYEKQLIEKGLDNSDNWIWLHTGKSFDIVSILDVPKAQHLPVGFFLVDDAEIEDQPERYKGQLPNIGYLIKDLPKKGFFFLQINLYFSDGLEGMDPATYAEIMRSGVPYGVNAL